MATANDVTDTFQRPRSIDRTPVPTLPDGWELLAIPNSRCLSYVAETTSGAIRVDASSASELLDAIKLLTPQPAPSSPTSAAAGTPDYTVSTGRICRSCDTDDADECPNGHVEHPHCLGHCGNDLDDESLVAMATGFPTFAVHANSACLTDAIEGEEITRPEALAGLVLRMLSIAKREGGAS